MIEDSDIPKLKYLIEKGKKYGLKTPNHFLIYLMQQGYEEIKEDDVIALIKKLS